MGKSGINETYHDLQDLSGRWSEWTLLLLWNGYMSLLDFPQQITCRQKHADVMVCFRGNYSITEVSELAVKS